MLSLCVKRLLGAFVVVLFAGAVQAALPFDPDVPELDAAVRLPRWERAVHALAEEGRSLDACLADARVCEGPRLVAWRELVATFADAPALAQLRAVNSFVNAVPYRSDQEQYATRDYWAGPLEFMLGAGDCEDYAIAKYATLRRMGFAVDELQIVIVEDRAHGLAHAVLAARTDSDVLLLDNQMASPTAAAHALHYEPYYAVNEASRWLHRLPETSARGR